MNFTYYYYCSCGYDKVVHLHENEKIYQCGSCFNIEAKESQDEFYIDCQVCGHEEKIEGDVTFGAEIECLSCAVKGSIGIDESHQFILNQKPKTHENCSKCRKNRWKELEEEIPCPFCFKVLKIRMSNYWEEENNEK